MAGNHFHDEYENILMLMQFLRIIYAYTAIDISIGRKMNQCSGNVNNQG